MGPAIATEIILNSKLNEHYELIHVDTNVHQSLLTMGGWSLKKVGQNIRIYLRFLSVLQREKPDLTLIPMSQTTIGFLKDAVFIVLSGMLSSRTLVQLRGSDFKNWLARSSGLTRAIVKFALGYADGVIVLGEKLRHLFADYFPEERIHVVPNGANYQLSRNKPPKSKRQLNILYLANLMPSKGIDDVIEAVRILKKKGMDNFVLDVVGNWTDDHTQARCIRKVRSGGLPVIFHGRAVGKVKLHFLESADLFVFVPRAPEGHPWVIVEALAAGLPVISTDQGAITESVLEGINGYIVDSSRPRQLAERMKLLLEQPEMRKRFSAASKAHYVKNFTEERMVERLSTVFDNVMDSKLSHSASVAVGSV